MTTEELKSLTPHKVVDARGTACPGPLLAAKKAVADMETGQIMEVISSDEGTTNDIPKWCRKMEYEYYGVIEEDGIYRLFLMK
jgi:tRNA 2-thiouridine synthesizing protein A